MAVLYILFSKLQKYNTKLLHLLKSIFLIQHRYYNHCISCLLSGFISRSSLTFRLFYNKMLEVDPNMPVHKNITAIPLPLPVPTSFLKKTAKIDLLPSIKGSKT